MSLSMAIVMDYQNVHITASEYFLPGRPIEEALIDPFKFAVQLAQAKNATSTEPYHVDPKRIEVYRGLPIPEDDPDAYRRNLEQKKRWEYQRSGKVEVTLRPLKYKWDYVDSKRVPLRESRREKGVDVLCALSLVRLARCGLYDVVVLASHDSDLAPAIDEAKQMGSAKIETVKWYDPANKMSYGYLNRRARVWTTSLTREHFHRCLDPHEYA